MATQSSYYQREKLSIIGETLDDAVGESYDKVARMLGLEYPGGPKVGMLAQQYRDENVSKKYGTKFPRPLLHSHDLNFSFSGLKTHILYFLRDYRKTNDLSDDNDLPQDLMSEICFEFEETAKEVFLKKPFFIFYKYTNNGLNIG